MVWLRRLSGPRVRIAVRVVVAALGVGALGALVVEAGPRVVLATVLAAGAWLPLLMLAELAAATADVFAVRALYDIVGGATARTVPARVWVRSGLLALASAQFLPGGRVLGEVARATSLSPAVGAPRAAAVAILTHGTYLFTISLTATIAYFTVGALPTPSALLSGLLLWTAGFTAVLGAVFLVGPRVARIGGFLGRRIGILGAHGPELDAALARAPLLAMRPFALFSLARLIHLAQSAVLLLAIGAGWDTARALTSEAIQLVAANLGDTVPGQTGVTEAAYRTFAENLGLSLDLHRALTLALSMALLVRIARLTTASVGALVAAAWGPRDLAEKPASATLLAPLLTFLVAPLLAFVWAPSLARADEPAVQTVVRERLVGVANPIGAEHMIALGVRARLGAPDEPLMAGAHLEVGAVAYTSPVYAMTGGYVQLSPVAFLVLRAETTSVALWSIGMDGAGFYPVDGYGADVRSTNLPAARGRIAAGVNVQLSAILQLAVDIGPVRPILWSQLVAEHETLGEEPYHYSPKYDLVLARSDWMIASTTMLLAELSPSTALHVRLGAYDDIRVVPASGHVVHQLGPTVMVALDQPGETLRELLFFARAGTYLEPARREGQWTGLAGLIARYDL